MSDVRTIAVIGAGPDRKKFANKCVRCYRAAGYTVFPVHPSATHCEGLPVYRTLAEIPSSTFDIVSIYVAPSAAIPLLDTLAPGQVLQLWLNPGVDTPEVIAAAKHRGLNVVTACTILAAGFTPADFPDE